MADSQFTTKTFQGDHGGLKSSKATSQLALAYEDLQQQMRLGWTYHNRLMKRLGSGSQGVVFLSERRGSDDFTLPVALKIFSPSIFETPQAYDDAMRSTAAIAARVSQIQHDILLDVHNFIAKNGVRIMEMEWVDGYDLHRLLTSTTLEKTRDQVSDDRWSYLNRVIITDGHSHPRLKPGIAIAVLRQCLTALSALHRNGIVHSDIKPSNIMLKRTGNAKIVDMGSAFDPTNPPRHRGITPAYAAPEVLAGQASSPQSDLASLGYVLVEMLAGTTLFSSFTDFPSLIVSKTNLIDRLAKILPDDVIRNRLLMKLIHNLVDPEPDQRFQSAEAANLVEYGAASFHRQLVKNDLDSEYENELRVWLSDLD